MQLRPIHDPPSVMMMEIKSRGVQQRNYMAQSTVGYIALLIKCCMLHTSNSTSLGHELTGSSIADAEMPQHGRKYTLVTENVDRSFV